MFSFDVIKGHGEHEQVVLCYNKSAGLKAIIAIHNTTLGPALGGTRMWTYNNDEEALIDVLRLSKGMTYKAAAAGLNLGGGKAVIIGDPKKDKTECLFRAFGRYVESLNGRYFTAEDVGTDVNDMEFIYMETKYVTGIDVKQGGSGDPSPFTAHGVLMGIKACAKERFGSDSLKGLRVAVQGVGNVGSSLIDLLYKEKAHVIATDSDRDRLKRVADKYNCDTVTPDSIYDVEADIFSPCALGAIINDETIDRLKIQIVAGGANNQLKEERHGNHLREKNILYAPDYVINAGGLMNVYVELEGYSRERALNMTRGIYVNLLRIFEIAKSENVSTNKAADRVAEERISRIGKIKQSHLGNSTRIFNTIKINNR